jgi:Tfp pilus assembly protein PilF
MREQPEKCPWRNGPRVRLSGQALMALLLVLIPSAGFGRHGIWFDPEDARSYYNRGLAWCEKKDYDKAISEFTEAIRLDPNFARPYFVRGTIWGSRQEYDKAIADYTEVIRINPKDVVAHVLRGNAWSNKKEYDKAIADYTKLIRIDPEQAAGWYMNRGEVWRAKKEYDKAIEDFTEAIHIDPKGTGGAVGYNNLAWLWATCPDAKYRNGKKARESATRACEITKWKDAEFLDTLAAAYAEAGDFESALKWQTSANALSVYAKEKKDGEARLKLYQDKQPYRETEP